MSAIDFALRYASQGLPVVPIWPALKFERGFTCGCGKGTQAKLLAESYDLVHISVGDIFRWNIQARTKLAARIARIISEGWLVPDEIVAQLCDALGLVGTAEYCARRIAEMTKLGVRNLYLMPFQTFAAPEPEVRAFRDVVFPHLHAAGLR